MMVDRVGKSERVWLDRAGQPIEAAPRLAFVQRQQQLTRRGQALLAAAGEVAPERRWYVVRVAPGQDKAVDNSLAEAGIDRWMPEEKRVVKRRVAGGRMVRKDEMRPCLIGYVFVHIVSCPEHWHGIKKIDGCLDVLGGMERPWPVLEKEFAELRDLFGLSPKARERVLAERVKQAMALEPGDPVRVTAGQLAGRTGDYEGEDGTFRAWVMMSLFGGRVPVSVPLADIERIGVATAPQDESTERGRPS